MTEVITILALILGILVAVIVLHGAYIRHGDRVWKRDELKRLKEALDDEVCNGHDLTRIAYLRERVRALQADLDGR